MQLLSETLRLSSFMQWFPREANNNININGAFYFCPLIYASSFYFQNLPSYLTWIGKYGPMYITCHEVVGISTLSIWSEWCRSLNKTLWVIRKKEPFSRWLAFVTFPFFINICLDCPTSFTIYKKCVNICEVNASNLGFRFNFKLAGYISWFYIDFNFLCCRNDSTKACKVFLFCSIWC
jgi:hypothetical protein